MKSLMVLALAVTSFWDFVWSCCTQYLGGGVWTYASNGGAFELLSWFENNIVQL